MTQKIPENQSIPIIVAENNSSFNHMITKILTRLGYAVIQAFNGKEAIEKVLEYRANVILLLDCMLTDITPEMVIKTVLERNKRLPILIMTSYGDEKIIVDLMKIGVKDYIQKDKNFNKTIGTIIKRVYEECDKEFTLVETTKALEEAELQWQMTFDGISDPVWMMTPDLTVAQCNKALCSFLNLKKYEIIGRKCYELIHGLEVPVDGCPCESMIQSKKRTTKYVTCNGKMLESTVYPIVDDKGEINSIIHVAVDRTEKIQWEQALKETVAKLKESQQIGKIGNWRVSLPEMKVEWSEEVFRIFGRNVEKKEPSFEEFWNYVHPDDIGHVQKQAEIQLHQPVDDLSYEYRIVLPSGEIKFLEHVGKKEYDGQGTVIAVYGTIQDITEKKQTRKELQESEEKYRNLVENVSDIICSLDAKGNITFISHNVEQMFGYTAEELLGSSYNCLVHEDDKERIVNEFAELLTGAGVHGEYRLCTKDNKVLWIRTSSKVVRDKNDTVIEIHTILTDITELKKSQEKLYESEKRFRQLAENMPGVIYQYVLDPKTGKDRFTYVSPGVKHIYAIEPEELVKDSNNAWNLIHEEDLGKLRASIIEAAQGMVNWCHEWRIKTSRNTIKWVRGEARPEMQKDGTIIWDGIFIDITQLKEMELKLQREHDRAQQYLDIAGVMFVALDVTGRVILANKKAAEIIKSKEHTIIGKNWFDTFIPKEIRKNVKKVFDQIIKGDVEPVEYYENPILRYDGEERLIAWHNAIIRDAQGEVIGVISSGEDVTERKKAESELRSTKEFTERALNAQKDTFFVFDPKTGEAIRWNRAFTEVSGYSDQEIAKLKAPDTYYRKEELNQAAESISEVLEKGYTKVILNLICKDGTEVPTEYYASLLKGQNGNPKYIISIGRDISERLLSETIIAESEERFRQFFNNAPEYCFMISTDRKILNVNRTALEIFGYTKEDLVGQPILKLIKKEWHKPVKEYFQEWLKTGKIINKELEVVTQKGAVRKVLLSATAVKDKKGKIIHSVSIQKDITDYEQTVRDKEALQEQLHQSQKMESIGQLAGGIAHDFNNILGGIMGYAEVLDMKESANPTVVKYSEKIKRSALNASELVRKLLTFARRAVTEMKPIDLHESLNQAVSMLEHTLDRKIAIQTEFKATKSTIEGDQSQIDNMFLNIAINARDAMPKGGTLTISSESIDFSIDTKLPNLPADVSITKGEYICVSVKDTGTGMSEKTISKIFDPFFTTKEIGKGTGLGLASVFGSIKQHNGFVGVESEQKKGTTFSLYFPLLSETELSQEKQTEEPTEAVLKGTGSLLIIDDESAICEALSDFLIYSGYSVTAFQDGNKGLEFYRQHFKEVDTIILDLVMPEISGTKCFEELRNINPEAKVIVVSGYFEDDKLPPQIKDEAMAFVQKPYRINELLKVLSEITA